MFFRARNDRGFSVIELMMVVLMIGTLAAIAMPVMKDMTASIKLNEAARMVEREMADARLKAVSSNRVIRVRLNCPATGYIRSVEVLGTDPFESYRAPPRLRAKCCSSARTVPRSTSLAAFPRRLPPP